MGLFSSIAKNLNPLKLVTSAVGGTLGKALAIATNVVKGIAEGKSFGEIMKGVLKDVAALAISAAITYFTGGTASIFVDAMLNQAKGILGQVAGKVASSALDKAVSGFLSGQINKFADTLTGDLLRKELTDLVLKSTGLKDEHERLEQQHLDVLRNSNILGTFLEKAFEANTTPSTRGATQASILATLGRPVDAFDAR